MRKPTFITKRIEGFAPELHWDIILMCMSVLVIVLSVYIGFVYITIDDRIVQKESVVATDDVNTGKDEQSLKKIINMESVIVGYREKEHAYKDLLKALTAGAPVPVVTTSSATSTTVVASSSLR